MNHCEGGLGAWAANLPWQAAAGYPSPHPGNATYDGLQAIVDWVERGSAPDSFIGTKYINDTASMGIAFQRPICLYPAMPYYNGTGNVNASSSWICK